MFSIRRNVFETNSSSTHSMAIPHNHSGKYPSYISFHIGEYGWGNQEPDPADYFYTAIACLSGDKEDFLNYRNKLIDILNRNSIEYRFEEPKFYEKGYFYLEYGYVDHGYELKDFIEYLFNNEDELLKFIFYGRVFTGNDNDDESYPYVNRNEKYIFDWYNKYNKEENPYYDKDLAENYDWYYKGN